MLLLIVELDYHKIAIVRHLRCALNSLLLPYFQRTDKRRNSVLLLIVELDYHKIAIVRHLWCALNFLLLPHFDKYKLRRMSLLLDSDFDYGSSSPIQQNLCNKIMKPRIFK